jgi:hypothetical protein
LAIIQPFFVGARLPGRLSLYFHQELIFRWCQTARSSFPIFLPRTHFSACFNGFPCASLDNAIGFFRFNFSMYLCHTVRLGPGTGICPKQNRRDFGQHESMHLKVGYFLAQVRPHSHVREYPRPRGILSARGRPGGLRPSVVLSVAKTPPSCVGPPRPGTPGGR